MRELISTEGIVRIFDKGEEAICMEHNYFSQADYAIVQTDILDTITTETLLLNGFSFHDRKLYMEINVEKTSEQRKRIVGNIKGFSMHEKSEITEETYILACQVFRHDRRFHLEHHFNQKLANAVIEAYLNDLNNRNIFMIEARYNDEVLGCVVLEKHAEGIFENVLGLTRDGIKGKMVAGGLYNYALEFMIQGKEESCKKYYGNVSTTNLQSINLHLQLGAKIKEIYDEYIWRKIKFC